MSLQKKIYSAPSPLGHDFSYGANISPIRPGCSCLPAITVSIFKQYPPPPHLQSLIPTTRFTFQAPSLPLTSTHWPQIPSSPFLIGPCFSAPPTLPLYPYLPPPTPVHTLFPSPLPFILNRWNPNPRCYHPLIIASTIPLSSYTPSFSLHTPFLHTSFSLNSHLFSTSYPPHPGVADPNNFDWDSVPDPTYHFDAARIRILLYEKWISKLSHILTLHHWCWCWRCMFVPSEVIFLRSSKKVQVYFVSSIVPCSCYCIGMSLVKLYLVGLAIARSCKCLS